VVRSATEADDLSRTGWLNSLVHSSGTYLAPRLDAVASVERSAIEYVEAMSQTPLTVTDDMSAALL